MPDTHAKWNPSGLAGYDACPGRKNAEEGMPRRESEAAATGTMLHNIAEQWLRDNREPAATAGLSREQWDIVEIYVNYVMSLPGTLLPEVKVAILEDQDCWGTADALVIDGTCLHVVDLKTGVMPVSPDSLQLKAYGLGGLKLAWMFGNRIEQINLHIVQPKLDPATSVSVYSDEEIINVEYHIQEIIKQASDPNAPRTPSEAACQWCRAKGVCGEHAAWATQGMLVEIDDLTAKPPAPADLTPDQMGQILTRAPDFKKWLSGVEQHAQALLERGDSVPGYKLVRTNTKRKWRDEEAVLETIRQKSGLAMGDLTVRKPLSIAQMEKALKGTKRFAHFSDLIEKPEGRLTIAPESDKREAVTSSLLSEIEEIENA